MKNYYRELPDGYALYKEIDAKSIKTVIIMNLVAALMIIAVIVPLVIFYLVPEGAFDDDKVQLGTLSWFLIIFFGGYIGYIVLHELTHGAAYKILTGEKLTFGFTASVAFCGLKEGFVNKRTALISILAPFVLFTLIFGALIIFLPPNLISTAVCILFACHVGGCAGDLYGTLVLLGAPKDVLMCDTGPKQSFYSQRKN